MGLMKKCKRKLLVEDKIFYIISYSFLTILLIVVAYPLYFMLIASISDPEAIYNGHVILGVKGFNLEGFKAIFESQSIWLGYRNSLFYMIFGTLLNLVITIPAGYALSRKNLVGRRLIMILFIITLFFKGGLIPTYLLVHKLNLYDTPWIMLFISALSVFNLIIAKSFFESTVTQEIIDAAKIDGCDEIKCFISIILPVSKAVIAVIGLYYGVAHWNSYFNGLIFLRNENFFPLQLVLKNILLNANAAITLLPQDARESIEEQQKIVQALKYGVVIVASLPVMLIYPFIQKFFVQGVMIGSVKG